MIKITNIVALPLARQGLVTTSVRTPYRTYSFASTTIRPYIEREPFSTDRPRRNYPLSLILGQQLRPHQLRAFVKSCAKALRPCRISIGRGSGLSRTSTRFQPFSIGWVVGTACGELRESFSDF